MTTEVSNPADLKSMSESPLYLHAPKHATNNLCVAVTENTRLCPVPSLGSALSKR